MGNDYILRLLIPICRCKIAFTVQPHVRRIHDLTPSPWNGGVWQLVRGPLCIHPETQLSTHMMRDNGKLFAVNGMGLDHCAQPMVRFFFRCSLTGQGAALGKAHSAQHLSIPLPPDEGRLCGRQGDRKTRTVALGVFPLGFSTVKNVGRVQKIRLVM